MSYASSEDKDENMVCWDGCDDWYHMSCVNQKRKAFREMIGSCLWSYEVAIIELCGAVYFIAAFARINDVLS